jgi:hypothetical protein
LLVQPLLPNEDNDLLPPSWIVEQGLLPPAFFAYGMLVYGALGMTYVRLDPPGRGLRRGLTFGFLYVAMWFPLLLEPLPHSAQAGWVTLIGYPLADSLGLMVLGAFLGALLPEPSRKRAAATSRGLRLREVSIVAGVYLAARTLSASTLPLYTWFADRPLLSTAWAAITGLCFGVMFTVCRPWLADRPRDAAVAFTLGIVGANLLLFNGFMLLVARVDPVDLVVRTALDLVALGLGTWVAAASSRGASTSATR